MKEKFYFDNKEVIFEPGQTILEAILKAGFFIPHYCYHSQLSKVATCRMCLIDIVDTGNGRPLAKLQTSCTTPAMGGMKVEAENKNVKNARNAVLEFLLVNHPLDCTICDQSGECDLQDYAYEFGSGKSIVKHQKRVYGERDIGSFLTLERNRCIHCTRCVRFSEEITKTHELGTFGRGHQLTVDTYFDFPLTDSFQGNLADICPVGAITTKDFRFKKSSWMLKKIPSICDQCSTGCNINIYFDKKKIYRIKPRKNDLVNKDWMCDYGRIGFHKYEDSNKAQTKYLFNDTQIVPTSAIKKLYDYIKFDKNIIIINSGHSTLEEAAACKMIIEKLNMKSRFYYFPIIKDTTKKGPWINNLISSEKAPNKNSLKLLKYKQLNFSDFEKINLKQSIIILIGSFDYTVIQKMNKYNNEIEELIQISYLKYDLLSTNGLVIPIKSPLEKTGIYINKENLAQQINGIPYNNYNRIDELQIWQNLIKNSVEFSNSILSNDLIYKYLKDINPIFKNIRIPLLKGSIDLK